MMAGDSEEPRPTNQSRIFRSLSRFVLPLPQRVPSSLSSVTFRRTTARHAALRLPWSVLMPPGPPSGDPARRRIPEAPSSTEVLLAGVLTLPGSCEGHLRVREVERITRIRCLAILESSVFERSKDLAAGGDWRAVPDIWKYSAERYGDRVALVDPYHVPPSKLTYKQLEEEIRDFSEGLRVIGVIPEDKLALFADNSCRWLVADQGIMATGAVNVVRGTRSSDEELFQIYKHSESVALVVDSPELLSRLARSFLSRVDARYIILLWGEETSLQSYTLEGIPLYTYEKIINLGKQSRQAIHNCFTEDQPYICETINPDDVATLMYTSGTSGTPKAVMLTHGNILHQIENLWDVIPAVPGDRFLSMLPSWHAYERVTEYFIFTKGIEQVYTNVRNLKEDLRHYQPHYLISVPLVYETLYSSIQKKISSTSAAKKFVAFTLIKISLLYMEMKKVYEGRILSQKPNRHSSAYALLDCLFGGIVVAILWPVHFLGMKMVYRKIHATIGISKAGVSGGGSLPGHVDKFFEAIGVKLQNGYGLTETSSVMACRPLHCNVLGTVGYPFKDTEIKIVDAYSSKSIPFGSKGIVKIRGPPITKGYYKNPVATSAAIDEDGWFNTGDIGWIAPSSSFGRSRKCGGMLVLEGRAKDTIVLTTGENVEPSDLEKAAIRSSSIQQIVVIGQDQRRLGALIVPNKDELLAIAKAQSCDLSREKMKNLLLEEVRTWTADCAFKIAHVLVVDEPFTIDNGLMTPTMKIRRDMVVAKYRDQFANLYKQH